MTTSMILLYYLFTNSYQTFKILRYNLYYIEMNFFLIVRQWLKKEIPKPLGRWSNECIKKTTKKIDWANEDHCGPCGTSKPKYPKKN